MQPLASFPCKRPQTNRRQIGFSETGRSVRRVLGDRVAAPPLSRWRPTNAAAGLVPAAPRSEVTEVAGLEPPQHQLEGFRTDAHAGAERVIQGGDAEQR